MEVILSQGRTIVAVASVIQHSSGRARTKHTIVSILFFSAGDNFLIAYGVYYSGAGLNREQMTERTTSHSWRNPGALRQVNTRALVKSVPG